MDEPNTPEEAEDFAERLRNLLMTAEVMSILFTRASQSLIIDFRTTQAVGPRVTTDEVVSSAHDRFLSFGRLRPQMPLPEQLTLAFWTSAVREFKDRGMLDILTERSRRAAGQFLVDEVLDSYRLLLKLERQYLCDMARGIGMKTLWERARK
jgi:hypothetical protein